MSQDDTGLPRGNAGAAPKDPGAHAYAHSKKHATRKFRGARAKGMRTDLHDFCTGSCLCFVGGSCASVRAVVRLDAATVCRV